MRKTLFDDALAKDAMRWMPSVVPSDDVVVLESITTSSTTRSRAGTSVGARVKRKSMDVARGLARYTEGLGALSSLGGKRRAERYDLARALAPAVARGVATQRA